MKMLTGLLPPTEGEAKLFGKPVDAGSIEARKHLGYMTQAFSLYGELTVAPEPLDRTRASITCRPSEAKARIEELVQRFGLGHVRRRPRRVDAAGPAPAALARGRGHPRAGDADPRRADVRASTPSRATVLGAADRPVAAEAGHHLRLDPLHERGDALRPHLADARGRGAGVRHPAGADGGARRRRAWRRRSSATWRTPAGEAKRRRDASERRAGSRGAATDRHARARHPERASPFELGRLLAYSRHETLRSSATRCGSPSRSSARWS